MRRVRIKSNAGDARPPLPMTARDVPAPNGLGAPRFPQARAACGPVQGSEEGRRKSGSRRNHRPYRPDRQGHRQLQVLKHTHIGFPNPPPRRIPSGSPAPITTVQNYTDSGSCTESWVARVFSTLELAQRYIRSKPTDHPGFKAGEWFEIGDFVVNCYLPWNMD